LPSVIVRAKSISVTFAELGGRYDHDHLPPAFWTLPTTTPETFAV